MAVLITGGAGFIGSHTCVELLNRGEKIIVADNYVNSSPKTLTSVCEIAERGFKLYETDMLVKSAVGSIFAENDIDAVIHFAWDKSVSEKDKKPNLSNNLRGTFNILEEMKKHGCSKFIYSSSAAVYGTPEKLPVTEKSPILAENPHGSECAAIESLCREMYISDNSWTMIMLRNFTPMGAHPSGKIGENPRSESLMSAITAKALGKRGTLEIAGSGCPTRDSSCVRDYVHVTDLARGYAAALEFARKVNRGFYTYNLGSGRGYSVFEVLETFQRVNKIDLEYTVGACRPGDAAECYSDPSLAERELHWKAELTLEDMCRDAWNYAKNT